MIWAEKYRPQTFHELNETPARKILESFISSPNELPHLCVCGPYGAGKKTMINIFLKELFGDALVTTDVHHEFQSSAKKAEYDEKKILHVTTRESKYHIEFDTSRKDIKELLSLIEFMSVPTLIQKDDDTCKYRILIIYNAENLCKEIQDALRCLLENCYHYCRVIFSCCAVTKLTQAIRSRCCILTIPAPTKKQVAKIIQFISKKEKIDTTQLKIEELITNCNRNLLLTLMMFEIQVKNLEIDKSHLQQIDEIVQIIKKDQVQPQSIFEIRRLFYLLLKKLPPKQIFHLLFKKLIESKNGDQYAHHIARYVAYYEHLFSSGAENPIIFLEAFAIKIILLLQ